MTNTFTLPQGFKLSGLYAGIKKKKKDVGLIVSDIPAICAGVFTQNKVCAAPVTVSKNNLTHVSARAIIVNSGNANACTGDEGMRDALSMVNVVAETLGCSPEEVFVASTGVIGQKLPIEKITSVVPELASSVSTTGAEDFAEAICTTDTFKKMSSRIISVDRKEVTIAGFAKGSGMIAPNMATMLGFILTDVAIEKKTLQALLAEATEISFNRVDVDGDTSTNDMVIVMANGAAKNEKIIDQKNHHFAEFKTAFIDVCQDLAKMIATDGEGATKMIEITVSGAQTKHDADLAGRAIATSSLVKTAMYGCDANWGRIAAAVGYSGAEFIPEEMEIEINKLSILKKNYEVNFSEEEAKRRLSNSFVAIDVNLNCGSESATFWTCDLTKDYVDINANYRS